MVCQKRHTETVTHDQTYATVKPLMLAV